MTGAVQVKGKHRTAAAESAATDHRQRQIRLRQTARTGQGEDADTRRRRKLIRWHVGDTELEKCHKSAFDPPKTHSLAANGRTEKVKMRTREASVQCQTCPVPDLSCATLVLCRLVLCQTARTRGASVQCQTRADMRVSLCEPCRSMCIPEGGEGHHALMPFSSPTEKR